MLSEDEKKAIYYLQLCYDLSTIDNKSLPKLATVLNLIEKQQNKIENAKTYLEYYLICNNKYENAQKEFKKLFMMLGGD